MFYKNEIDSLGRSRSVVKFLITVKTLRISSLYSPRTRARALEEHVYNGKGLFGPP